MGSGRTTFKGTPSGRGHFALQAWWSRFSPDDDGRYGALAGKMISLEPATGFSFDSPLTYRPR